MGVLEFVSALAASLAWPAAVVACVVILRHHIAGLFRRLQSFEIGGQKATFGDLDEVENTVAKVMNSTGSDRRGEGRDQHIVDVVWSPIFARAESSPRTAVLEAWNRLEHELNVLADVVEPNAPHGWPDVGAHLGVLDDWTGLRPALRELRQLRDTAAIGAAVPTPEDAARYVSVARDLSWSLDAIAVAIADRPRAGVRADEHRGPEASGSGR